MNSLFVHPFQLIPVDLAGLWKIYINKVNQHETPKEIWVFTILDIGSYWIELHLMDSKKLIYIAKIFDNK